MRKSNARPLQIWTWGASVVLHVALIGGFGWLALRSAGVRVAEAKMAGASRAGDGTIAIDLPGVTMGTLTAERPPDPKGDPPRYFGGAERAQLDDSKLGRGGAQTTTERPTNLSDRDERIHLTPDLLNRLDIDQQQRIRSARERATWEDRRASREPMELSFLASGKGDRAERRTPSDADPSRGARASDSPSVQGSARGMAERTEGELESPTDLGSEREGSVASAPGLGVHDAREGTAHRTSAHVMRARPDVVLAAVSVPATRNGRPRDDIESDQAVATTLRSLVHASTAAGTIGQASGGVGGGGDPGAGGTSGSGSTGRPIGPGDSEWWDLNTSDPRLLPYFRRIHQKLDPLWAHAFPLRAALDLRQGTVIFAVTIDANGEAHVEWPPSRPSGIPEFDRNCYDAIRKASPFDPIPAALGTNELHVRMPFDAQNPIVK